MNKVNISCDTLNGFWIINHWSVCFIDAQFLTSVGVSSKWRINDVYGLDSELLATLPSPALAVLLLFPLNNKVTYLLWWSCWMCKLLWLCFLFVVWKLLSEGRRGKEIWIGFSQCLFHEADCWQCLWHYCTDPCCRQQLGKVTFCYTFLVIELSNC